MRVHCSTCVGIAWAAHVRREESVMRRGWMVSLGLLIVALPAVAAPATPANPLLQE